MRPRTNPLALLLRGGSDEDDYAGALLVVAIHEREPEARGRAPGLYRSGSNREVVYSGTAPDLSLVPSKLKVIVFDSAEDDR